MELIYEIWLTMKLSFQVRKIRMLLEKFKSPSVIFNLKQETLRETGFLTSSEIKAFLDKNITYARNVVSYCAKNKIKIMTIRDEDYPERLYNIPDPPQILYIAGELPSIDDSLVIAMVGTRDSSPYGEATAQRFAKKLTKSGAIIVSGMARGVDSSSHRGCLSSGGKTIAVIGSGLDIVYPPEHEDLMVSIMNSGCVISEYPPGTPPRKEHFPRRNRIISGLSLGVIVIEAPRRSGSLITMSTALEQGRDVFAVPGNVDDPHSTGSNLAILDGAKIVTDVSDVLIEYEGIFPYLKTPVSHPVFVKEAKKWVKPLKAVRETTRDEEKQPENKRVAIPDDLADNEKAVLRILERGPKTLEDILEESGLEIARLNAILTELEIMGLTQKLPGKQFQMN